jgi:hypothetical protein
MDHRCAINLLNDHLYLVGKVIKLHSFEFRITRLILNGNERENIVRVYLAPEELENPPCNLWREFTSLSLEIDFERLR